MPESRLIEMKIKADTRPFKRQMRRCERALRALAREQRRQGLPPKPGWIDRDPPLFAFPGWGPRWRPFDWSVDA